MATYCLFCGGLAPCETHTYAMFDPWQSMLNAAASHGQKKATSGFTWPAAKYPNPWLGMLNVIGTDADGRRISEVVRGARPEHYFWLGADADPQFPVVTSIAFRTVDGFEEIEQKVNVVNKVTFAPLGHRVW